MTVFKCMSYIKTLVLKLQIAFAVKTNVIPSHNYFQSTLVKPCQHRINKHSQRSDPFCTNSSRDEVAQHPVIKHR